MQHSRADYNRIQDPAGLIPVDEPVYLFRGQDKYAAEALRFYAHTLPVTADPEVALATFRQAAAMDNWHIHKVPDITPVAKISPIESKIVAAWNRLLESNTNPTVFSDTTTIDFQQFRNIILASELGTIK